MKTTTTAKVPGLRPRVLYTQMLNDGPVTMIDIRETDRRDLMLSGCLHIPESKTTQFVRRINQTATAVVLVCTDGRASAAVAKSLRLCGHSNVTYIEGGVNAWKGANLPVIKGVPPPGSPWGALLACAAILLSLVALAGAIWGSGFVGSR